MKTLNWAPNVFEIPWLRYPNSDPEYLEFNVSSPNFGKFLGKPISATRDLRPGVDDES